MFLLDDFNITKNQDQIKQHKFYLFFNIAYIRKNKKYSTLN